MKERELFACSHLPGYFLALSEKGKRRWPFSQSSRSMDQTIQIKKTGLDVGYLGEVVWECCSSLGTSKMTLSLHILLNYLFAERFWRTFL